MNFWCNIFATHQNRYIELQKETEFKNDKDDLTSNMNYSQITYMCKNNNNSSRSPHCTDFPSFCFNSRGHSSKLFSLPTLVNAHICGKCFLLSSLYLGSWIKMWLLQQCFRGSKRSECGGFYKDRIW